MEDPKRPYIPHQVKLPRTVCQLARAMPARGPEACAWIPSMARGVRLRLHAAFWAHFETLHSCWGARRVGAGCHGAGRSRGFGFLRVRHCVHGPGRVTSGLRVRWQVVHEPGHLTVLQRCSGAGPRPCPRGARMHSGSGRARRPVHDSGIRWLGYRTSLLRVDRARSRLASTRSGVNTRAHNLRASSSPDASPVSARARARLAT